MPEAVVYDYRFVPADFHDAPWTRLLPDETQPWPPARREEPFPSSLEGETVYVHPKFIEWMADSLRMAYIEYGARGNDDVAHLVAKNMRGADQTTLARVEVGRIQFPSLQLRPLSAQDLPPVIQAKPSKTLIVVLAITLFIAWVWTMCIVTKAAADADEFSTEPLTYAVQELRPQISLKLAQRHIDWARAAVAGTHIEPEMALAMAFRESGLNPFVVSRKQCDGDVCHRERSVMREPGPLDQLPFFCGVMQMRSRSWEECQRYASDTEGSYRLAMQHLLGWYNDPACNKVVDADERMTCALLGYGGGYPLIRIKDYPYPKNVRAVMARLKQRSFDHANI